MTEYPNKEILVDADWLTTHLDDADIRIADARMPLQYSFAHIKNAVNVPVMEIMNPQPGYVAPKEVFERVLGERGISNDHTIIIYDGSDGSEAARLFWSLEYYGHSKAKLLNVSFMKWYKDKRPVTAVPADFEETKFFANADEGKRAPANYIMNVIKDPNTTILDTRLPEEYSGAYVFGGRPGHIPGAKLLPWNACFGKDSICRPANELTELLAERDVSREKDVITYCWTGLRSSYMYFILRLMGYPKVRHYDASFSEWAFREDLPAEV